MKNLYILRHAKTNQLSKTGRDFDRELLPKGDKQVLLLNQYFKEQPFINPTDVWISKAKRTQQTFDGIKKVIESSKKIASIHSYDDLYLVSQDDLLRKIWNNSSSNDLMIVGHNYGISDLVNYFTEKNTELRTGEFIHLTFESDTWAETSKGLATIIKRFRPIAE